ncbi:MAG: NnrS family protein [Phycisphaerales bacterium]
MPPPAPNRPSLTFVSAPTISVGGDTARRRDRRFWLDAFRPFYLGGALLAAIAVPLWLGMWYHAWFTPSLPPLLWHAHEMVFGFGVAIIIGFLFTAARNWTGLPLPAGAPLAGVFSLWAAGRAGMLLAYGIAVAVVDSLLLVIVAAVLARKFSRAGSFANMPLVGVLAALALANIAFHGAMLGLLRLAPLTAVEAGLLLVVMIQLIVGGRVVPGFTASAIPTQTLWRPRWLPPICLALSAMAILADTVRLSNALTGVLCLAAGVGVAVQAAGWKPLGTLRRPMVWVLHLSYAWIPVGLLLLGAASFGLMPRSAAIHALAVGSMGGLILAMTTRTTLGHSGRPVRAGAWDIAAFALVHLAAACRVIASIAPPVYLAGIAAAGFMWAAAFLIFVGVYAPLLLGRTRP